jgi:hypothetical protein
MPCAAAVRAGFVLSAFGYLNNYVAEACERLFFIMPTTAMIELAQRHANDDRCWVYTAYPYDTL